MVPSNLFRNCAHYDTAGSQSKSVTCCFLAFLNQRLAAASNPRGIMIGRLTRLQRITLVLFVIVVTNRVMVSATGYSLLGGDLFTLFLIVFLALSSVTLAGSVMRKVRYKVRNRIS